MDRAESTDLPTVDLLFFLHGADGAEEEKADCPATRSQEPFFFSFFLSFSFPSTPVATPGGKKMLLWILG